MIDLANTLLPNLPSELTWVYGVVYLFMTLIFLILIIMPFITIINVIRHRKRRY